MKSDFLKEHLNVWWLRPESALWDAVASSYISKLRFVPPILDLGSGNGIFSFITAGGQFSVDYDWFLNTDLGKKDIYNTPQGSDVARFVSRLPSIQFEYAFDQNPNLLTQAMSLGIYRKTQIGNANVRLPFEDQTFQTVFSNILYWLDDLDLALQEVHRILRPGGQAILCMISSEFAEYCESYQWQAKNSEWLHRLNAGRSDCIKWMLNWDDLEARAKRAGFEINNHQYYLSQNALRFWDTGLRPFSKPLLKTISYMSSEERRLVKEEWIRTSCDLLEPLFQSEMQEQSTGGTSTNLSKALILMHILAKCMT